MEKILVADDEKEIAGLIEACLSAGGYEVIKCYSVSDVRKAPLPEVSLAILDIMLPDGDGFSLCRELREHYLFPIIMLTARDQDADKIVGLSAGADDYMTKPFQPMELMARVQAQLRRYTRYNPGRKEDEPGVLTYGGIRMDTLRHSCTLDGRELNLTPTEFTILKMLMESPGKVMSAEALYFGVWGEEYYSKNTNTITSHIRHLREKMGDVSDPKYIRTVWGIGYKLGEGGGKDGR